MTIRQPIRKFRRSAAGFSASIVLATVLLSGPAVDAQTCCQREWEGRFGPAGSGSFVGPDVFETLDVGAHDCPLQAYSLSKEGLEGTPASLARPEYALIGTLEITEGGFADDYALSITLIDLLHGETLRSARDQWQCGSSEAGYCSRVTSVHAVALTRQFAPLDDLIHRYEAMPQSARITIDEYSEPVHSEDELEIDLSYLLDSYGNAAKTWQRVLAKVEEGKILNGVPAGEHRVFEIGDGHIGLQYRAPHVCDEPVTETVTVYNTCNIYPDVPRPPPDDEIASHEFEVLPKVKGQLDLTYATTYYPTTGGLLTLSHSGKVPFEVVYETDPPGIVGSGSLSLRIDGPLGVCVLETKSPPQIRVELGGELIEYPDGTAELQFEVLKNYNYSATGILHCPDGDLIWEGAGSGEVEALWEFPVEDQHVLEWAAMGGGGTHRVTLELECPKQ